MDIYQNIDYIKKAEYSKFLYFTRTKYPRLSKCIQTIIPDSDPVFKKQYCRPLMVICETVNICCNDCIICPYSKMTRKKEIMPLKLFEKVLRDYSDMGGGKLSLTPKQGDIFFDKFLLDRLDLIKKYPKITGISVTTNAILSDQLTDENLKRVIDSFERIHISVYGIDKEEYTHMTQRDTYNRMLKNIQRIISLADNCDSVMLGFRFLKLHSSSEVEGWMLQHFHKKIPYGETNMYMDWGGSINSSTSLPFHGIWRQRKEGQSQCLIPLSACMIYSNGDVSFCSCNDFDIKDEFLLGNISRKSLTEIVNSPKNGQLWSSPTNLPASCKKCVSYRPFSDFEKYTFMFKNPVDFIGG